MLEFPYYPDSTREWVERVLPQKMQPFAMEMMAAKRIYLFKTWLENIHNKKHFKKIIREGMSEGIREILKEGIEVSTIKVSMSLIQKLPEKTDQEIAGLFGADLKLVQNARKRLSENAAQSKPETSEKSA